MRSGLAQAVLFPYLNLDELCFVVPLLCKQIKGLFEPNSPKCFHLTTFLRSRLQKVKLYFSPEQKVLDESLDQQKSWSQIIRVVAQLREVKMLVGRAPELIYGDTALKRYEAD